MVAQAREEGGSPEVLPVTKERAARRQRPEVQARVVEAAVDLLLNVTPADLLTAIGTRRIAERAGVSQATIFHQFSSVAELSDAVVARVFNLGEALPLHAMTDGLDAVRAAGLPVAAASMFHTWDFERLVADRELRLRMGLWSLGAGTTDEVFGEFLRGVSARMGSFLTGVLDHWGREPRPPLTIESYVAAHTGLLNGLTIRRLVDPETITPETFAQIATALNLVLTRAIGDQHELADRLAEINYYPLRNSQTGQPLTGKARETAASLMGAAAELFGVRGYAETTVAQITRGAGVSASTLYRLFGSKEGLATALFRKQVEDMLVHRAIVDDEPFECLRDHLVAVAVFVGNHTEHAPAYLSDLMGVRPRPDQDVLVARTTALVAALSGATGEEGEPEQADLAVLVLGQLIGRVLARPAELPPAQVAAVLAMVRLPGGGSVRP